jgi:hypothetical protein
MMHRKLLGMLAKFQFDRMRVRTIRFADQAHGFTWAPKPARHFGA